MLKNFFKIAWRNVVKGKAHSFINIAGLSVGMSVAMLIGLWIWDELSFNKYHENYGRIAQVMQHETYNGSISTGEAVPLPLDAAMRKSYGDDFRHIVLSSWTERHTLLAGDRKISYKGNFMSAEAPDMFTLKMLEGSRNGLKNPSSILISQSVAEALFVNKSPLNQPIRIDDTTIFNVSGVYEDLPRNTTLQEVAFIGPWERYITSPGNQRSSTDWGDNSLLMYVQLADNADMAKVSEKIKNIKLDKIDREDRKYKPVIFLQPMSMAFVRGV